MVFLNLLKGDNLSFRQMLAFHIYDLTGTVVGLLLLFYMSWNSALKKDMEELQRILNLKKEYFEMMKENIELVNLRCHDISQHLDQFSENGMGLINESAIQQVKKDIRIYDSFVKTGNEPLDVVLTEKSLHCEKMGIRITCMADGEKLNFMNAIDIYFVFGNIIQNAIEAVEKLENIEQRIISLTVKKKEELLLIQSENYYNSPVIIRDDLPVTTKSDMTAHGLGMKSIRMILQKYDGEMSIHTENEIFLLNIVIPFPKGSDIL